MSKRTAIQRLLSWPPPPDKSVTGEQISVKEELAERKMQIEVNYHNEQARKERENE